MLPINKAKCRREEEMQARLAAELAMKQLKELQAEDARRANKAAEMANQFFEGIIANMMAEAVANAVIEEATAVFEESLSQAIAGAEELDAGHEMDTMQGGEGEGEGWDLVQFYQNPEIS